MSSFQGPSFRSINSSAMSFVLFAFLLAGCSPVDFSTGNDGTPGAVGGNTVACTPRHVEDMHRLTKLIFVVDTSGSNRTWSFNPGSSSCGPVGTRCIPPTDPQKNFRGGAIESFFQRYRYKTNFEWSFATFAETSAYAHVNFGGHQYPVYTRDPNVMQGAIDTLYSLVDEGSTPYKAALQMAKKAVRNDPDLNSASKPNYFVILITDGFPTDYKDPAGKFDSSLIGQDIDSLIASAPGQVNLSTIYYGQFNDPSAVDLLRGMAQRGQGQFASVNDPNSGFRIEDVIPGGSIGCQ